MFLKIEEPLPSSPFVKGVTRLDGAGDKKQVWRPHVRTWGLSEEMYCIEVLVTLLGLFGAQGSVLPLPPPPCYAPAPGCGPSVIFGLKQSRAGVVQNWNRRSRGHCPELVIDTFGALLSGLAADIVCSRRYKRQIHND